MSTKLVVGMRADAVSQSVVDWALLLAQTLQLPTMLVGLARTESDVAALKEKLSSVGSQLKNARIRYKTAITVGDAVESLSAAVQEEGEQSQHHLIVVGQLTNLAFLRSLFGPKAMSLLERVDDAVLFVPPEAKATVERILLPIGALSYSQIAVDFGAALARALDAQITLLHVVHNRQYSPHPLMEPTSIQEFLASDSIFAQNFRQILADLQAQGILVTPRLRVGHPLRQMLAEVRETPYDLMVVGSHHSASDISQFMGGLSQSVMRQAGIPVLVARNGLEIGD